MIGYGIACLVVCALSFSDRRAMPFAFIILAGWLFGAVSGAISEDAWRLWPAISAVSATALYAFHLRDPDRRWALVSAVAGAMLLLDVLYLGFRWQRVPIEVEYSRALDFGLSVQLLIIGYQGAINGWVGFWDRVRGGVDKRHGLAGASVRKEAE